MIRVIYYDQDGVPRVYGDGETQEIALQAATAELIEYRKGRPEKDKERFTHQIFDNRDKPFDLIGTRGKIEGR